MGIDTRVDIVACAAALGDPRPGDARRLATLGLDGAVASLTRPSGPARLIGAAPHDEHGNPLDPINVWGDDHCWWLDRMVWSDQQLVERMTLVWHSWFATSEEASSAQLMIHQKSHFISRHYWEVRATDGSLLTGWMGRYLDVAGDVGNPFQGLPMDGQINPTMATATTPTVAIDQLHDYSVWVRACGETQRNGRWIAPPRSEMSSDTHAMRRSPRWPAPRQRWGSCVAP